MGKKALYYIFSYFFLLFSYSVQMFDQPVKHQEKIGGMYERVNAIIVVCD